MNDKLKLGECKAGLSRLVRPHFSEGLLLQDDDLTSGVNYTRELSRLMFRTLFGCGVLCGLKVSEPELKCGKLAIAVARGAALDCTGDPIEVPKPQTLELDTCKVPIGSELWIGLKLTEKCCAPRTAACSPDDEPGSACTRERDGFELCVFSKRPPCSCGCAQLAPPVRTEPNPKDSITDTSQPEAAPAAAPLSASSASPASRTASPCGCGSTEEPSIETSAEPTKPCYCTPRSDTCYASHYHGDCPCDCSDCDWIVLAQISRDLEDKGEPTAKTVWKVDHSVRKFIRPVLMRDPVVADERDKILHPPKK